MNRYKTTLVISLMALALVILVPIGMSLGGQPSGDTSEADYCASCHYNPAQVDIANEWKASAHGNSYLPFLGNTYCASCHSPFQADPDATHGDNDPIPLDEWEGVTCGACHPPHDLRVEWGTPIGNYDVAAGEWVPVYEEDANDLCEFCHSGSRHEKEFQGYGTIMDKKDVQCIDCHMPVVPGKESDKEHRSHDFEVYPEYSCGLDNDDCHDNHKEGWAEKQIEKGIHEKGSYGQEKEKGK
jgi:hypothetical protein